MNTTNDADGNSGSPPCYASVREQDIRTALNDAISQIVSSIVKSEDAPCSSGTHLATAIVRIVSCLPGWEPNEHQREEVDRACTELRMLVPERFTA